MPLLLSILAQTEEPQPEAKPAATPASVEAPAVVEPTGETPAVAQPVEEQPDVVDESAAVAKADDGPRWSRAGFGFGGTPALGYDPDAGLLLGVVGVIFDYDGKTAPYRNALGFQILVTHKLVMDHAVKLDSLRVLDLPLRTTARLGFEENLGQNYCGLGPKVTCDPQEAIDAADAAGFVGEQRDIFLRRYYVFPYVAPNLSLIARYRIDEHANDPPPPPGAPTITKIEVFGGWRGALYVPGSILDDDGDGQIFDLYKGNRYALDFPVGEPGFASVFQAGVILDHRDNEPSPRRGWYTEASVRGAHPFVGSTWAYAGGNVTWRGYLPFDKDQRVVGAIRVIADATVGDLPVLEMAEIGGSTEYAGFGGTDLGRGIRGQRLLGRVKLLEQQELRWHIGETDLFGQRFGLITNAFLDAGVIMLELGDLGAHNPPMPIGFGGALGISWNENFILRIDLAFSPVENYSPYPYITLGQSF